MSQCAAAHPRQASVREHGRLVGLGVVIGVLVGLFAGYSPAAAQGLSERTAPAHGTVVEQAPSHASMALGENVHSRVNSATQETGQAPTSAPAATPPGIRAAEVIASTAQYMGLLLLAGSTFFARTAGQRLRGSWPVLWQWSSGGWLVAATASGTLIVVSAIRVAGLPLRSVIEPAQWVGGISGGSLLSAFLVAVAGGACVVLGRLRENVPPASAVVFGVIALITPALVGHSRSTEPVALAFTADAVHLAVAGVWLGGVVGLSVAMRTRDRRPRHEGGRTAALRITKAVVSFSRMAVISVGVLALSGVLMAWLILDSWAALWETDYGWLLLIKLSLVLCALGVAGWNHYNLLPRIQTSVSPVAAWNTLRKTLLAEVGILAAVLAVTGALTTASPHPGPVEAPAEASDEPADPAAGTGSSARGGPQF